MHSRVPTAARRWQRLLPAVLLSTSLVAAAGAVGGCGDDGGRRRRQHAARRLPAIRRAQPGQGARRRRADATWSLFESGPALTEALKAGAIDIGQIGEAPPIFAAAGEDRVQDHRHLARRCPKGEAVLVKEAKGFTSLRRPQGQDGRPEQGLQRELAAGQAAREAPDDARPTSTSSTSSPPRAGPPSTTTRSTRGSSGTRTSRWPSSPACRCWPTPPGWPATASTCSPRRTR